MKLLTEEEFFKLDRDGLEDYLKAYLSYLLETSIKKTQSSDNYKLPAWPYLQAEQIGSQKVLNKLLKLISYD